MSLVNRRIVAVALLGSVTCPVCAQQVKIPLIPNRWTLDGNGAFDKEDGQPVLILKNMGAKPPAAPDGEAVLNGLKFRNGTISFEVKPPDGLGPGIAFRRSDAAAYEEFYLRASAKCSEAFDCIQYAPQTHGVLLWDMFPQYQAPAPVRSDAWNRIKLLINGRRMLVYVNGTLSLRVGRLEGDTFEGGLALQGPGSFKNLIVTENAVEGLPPSPIPDSTATDRRLVRKWQLSPFTKFERNREPNLQDMPGTSAAWKPLAAERAGLVNVSRVYGLPPGDSLVWLKTTIHSSKTMQKKVSIGWGRTVWVFVNGKLVFADKNLYWPESERTKNPEGRISLENGTFTLPLKAGNNDISVALGNNFFGWGLIFRLEDTNRIASLP